MRQTRLAMVLLLVALFQSACMANFSPLATQPNSDSSPRLSTENKSQVQEGVHRISAGAALGPSQSVSSQVGDHKAVTEKCSGLAGTIVVDQFAAATCQTIESIKARLAGMGIPLPLNPKEVNIYGQ